MKSIDQNVIESFTSKLKTLGISTYAAKTYVVLLANPNVSAGFLCSETGIRDSKMYYALSELSKKGMILKQAGTPNTYKPVHPKEAIDSLKQQLAEDLNHRMNHADTLADSLSPIFESSGGKEDLELAYVIRGRRIIVKKMKDLISSARREVVIFISAKELFNELMPFISHIADVNKHVEIKLALAPTLFKKAKTAGLCQIRTLGCLCNLVISDMKTLITVSSWKNEIAIMTSDEGLITMSKEYYENPKCCKD